MRYTGMLNIIIFPLGVRCSKSTRVLSRILAAKYGRPTHTRRLCAKTDFWQETSQSRRSQRAADHLAKPRQGPRPTARRQELNWPMMSNSR